MKRTGNCKKVPCCSTCQEKRPRKAIAAETNRFIFLDGTIEDLGKGIPAVLMPVISDNYSKYIGWKGQGEIPAEKLEKVREYIRQTHAEG